MNIVRWNSYNGIAYRQRKASLLEEGTEKGSNNR